MLFGSKIQSALRSVRRDFNMEYGGKTVSNPSHSFAKVVYKPGSRVGYLVTLVPSLPTNGSIIIHCATLAEPSLGFSKSPLDVKMLSEIEHGCPTSWELSYQKAFKSYRWAAPVNKPTYQRKWQKGLTLQQARQEITQNIFETVASVESKIA